MRSSYTAVVERNVTVRGVFTSEPYECGWAGEAVVFVRSLAGSLSGTHARVQISPDGMSWCDHGTEFALPAEGTVTACLVTHFGNWLRIAADTGNREATIIVTLQLKE